jgi:hypothetical protein
MHISYKLCLSRLLILPHSLSVCTFHLYLHGALMHLTTWFIAFEIYIYIYIYLEC